MARIIMFLKEGRTSPETIQRKIELQVAGHALVMSNGSINKGFEDSCDAIVLCCKNDNILRWANNNGIDVEFLGIDPIKIDSPVNVEPEPEPEPEPEVETVDVSDAVAKAMEDVTEDPKHEVPPSVPAGTYVDPDGKEYIHKGRGYKKELREAIETHGVDAVKLKEE